MVSSLIHLLSQSPADPALLLIAPVSVCAATAVVSATVSASRGTSVASSTYSPVWVAVRVPVYSNEPSFRSDRVIETATAFLGAMLAISGDLFSISNTSAPSLLGGGATFSRSALRSNSSDGVPARQADAGS